MKNTSDAALRRFFRYTALLAGLAFAFLLPPFQAPDEFNHFFRAYQVSEGGWSGVRTPDQRLGGVLPRSLDRVAAPFRHLPFHFEGKTSRAEILKALQIPLNPADTAFLDFANTAIYPATAYLPQALVIAALRPFHCPPLWMLYAARIACLLCWIALTDAALALLPFGGRLFAALALLPASLALHASMNADIFTNGCCVLLTALLLRRAYPAVPHAVSHTLFAVFILSVLIALNKIVYVPLLLLLLLKKTNKPGQKQSNALIFSILVLLCGIVIAAWNGVAQRLFIPYDAYNPLYRDTQQLNQGVSPGAQWAYVLEHPLAFGQTLLVSYAKTLPAATVHVIGKFGWEKNYLPLLLVGALLLGLLLLAAAEKTAARHLRLRQRGVLASSAGSMALAFGGLMYLLWNPVGAPFIHNLGGKYFIPVVPLLLLAIVSGRLARWEGRLWQIFRLVLVFSLIVLLAQVVQRYYG